MTDTAGTLMARNDYDPYGRLTQVTGLQESPFGFTDHLVHPPSGLVLAPFRAYDPALGRWISSDPIKEAGGLNLYAYVDGNPINAIDPLGLASVEGFLAGASNFSAGLGDTLSFGLTGRFRQAMGYDDVVNRCSALYGAGEWSGVGLGLAMGGGGILKGGAQSMKTLLYDPRKFPSISRAFWRSQGGAAGRNLHHWLIPQRVGRAVGGTGIINGGWNQIIITGSLNWFMGAATQWGGRRAVIAGVLENTIRGAMLGGLGAPLTAASGTNSGCGCK